VKASMVTHTQNLFSRF